MSATRCLCGFERLDDEEVIDHLLATFEPEDSIGSDGQVHQEAAPMACLCAFTAASPRELDAHFLAAFTPADHAGRDGSKHEPAD